MFERPPFKICPQCGQLGFGILSVSSESYARRCKFCRTNGSFALPDLNKKVLYLDQFAISEVFKVKEGKRRPDAPNPQFWSEAAELLEGAIRYQQVICPASDIHLGETIVFHDGDALGLAHEMMGGDTSFDDTTSIEHRQIFRHFDAYVAGEEPPPFDSNVDQILEGTRNAWLPDLHISAAMDWSGIAAITRKARDRAAQDYAPLYEKWAREKPSFKTALDIELRAFGSGYLDAYFHFVRMAQEGQATNDAEKFINGALSPVVTLIHQLNQEFTRRGTSPEFALRETAKFLTWPTNQSLPHHWISAHLLAALADRIARGQKRQPSRGMMNDIKAIACYGPYVDAMFLDNECASILDEKAVAKGVKLKAKIFCLRHAEDFLAYLRDLISATPENVVAASHEIYGSA